MYKNAKIIAFFSSVVWLAFIYSAFSGFHFWYAGFVSFFWLSLAALNYRHDTTLWLLKNRRAIFVRLFVVLILIGFVGDFIVAQQLGHFWSYPYYLTLWAWLRLYLVIYPFGGLSILELMFFLGNIFHEKFVFTHYPKGLSTGAVDRSYRALDSVLMLFILGLWLLFLLHVSLPLKPLLFYGILLWVALSTIVFAHHIRHGVHWLAILLTVLIVSIFLHELPNTAVYEWRYYDAPFPSVFILGVPLWVFLGWYVMIVVMLRTWMHFAWLQRRLPSTKHV